MMLSMTPPQKSVVGILLWGYKCEKVFKLQKKIVRILSLSKYNAGFELHLQTANPHTMH